MPITTVSVYLDYAAIERANFPGGMVYDNVDRLGLEVELLSRTAILAGHTRTGRMLAGLKRGKGSANQFGVSQRVYIDSTIAPHARYVLGGTFGPITSNSGRPMPVGKSQGLPPSTWVHMRSVAGQEGDNFLGTALRTVVTRHGVG